MATSRRHPTAIERERIGRIYQLRRESRRGETRHESPPWAEGDRCSLWDAAPWLIIRRAMAKCFESWTVLPHGPLEKLSENLWRVEGTMPDGTTKRVMTIARMK